MIKDNITLREVKESLELALKYVGCQLSDKQKEKVLENIVGSYVASNEMVMFTSTKTLRELCEVDRLVDELCGDISRRKEKVK